MRQIANLQNSTVLGYVYWFPILKTTKAKHAINNIFWYTKEYKTPNICLRVHVLVLFTCEYFLNSKTSEYKMEI